jgi:hypothetical protein
MQDVQAWPPWGGGGGRHPLLLALLVFMFENFHFVHGAAPGLLSSIISAI